MILWYCLRDNKKVASVVLAKIEPYTCQNKRQVQIKPLNPKFYVKQKLKRSAEYVLYCTLAPLKYLNAKTHLTRQKQRS